MSVRMDYNHADLIRGEGEWRNMQDVVRRSFKYIFEQMERQQDQIAQLTSANVALKTQLVSRPTSTEIESILDNKFRLQPRTVSRDEYDSIRQQMVDFRADIERKATIRYVDDSCKRKLDKTDVLTKNLLHLSSPQHYTEVSRLASEVGEMKTKVDNFSRIIQDNTLETRAAAKIGDVNVLQSQVEEVYKLIAYCPTKQQVQEQLDEKIDIRSVDTILSGKVDRVPVSAQLNRIEQALADHEKIITTLRLRSNDDAVFTDPGFINPSQLFGDDTRGPPGGGGKTQKSRHHTAGGYHPATGYHAASEFLGDSDLDDEYNNTNTVPMRMREGRGEAIVTTMWQKLSSLEKIAQQVNHDQKSSDYKLMQIESTVQTLAEAIQVEALATLLEEQKGRIDSIVLGTTAIQPVDRELTRLGKVLQEVYDYLQLPKDGVLDDQLKDAGSLIDNVGRRLGDLSSALSKSNSRLECIESCQSRYDCRLAVAEDTLTKVDLLSSRCDLSGTRFETLRDVAIQMRETNHGFRDLGSLVATLETKVNALRSSSSTYSLLPRLETLESRNTVTEEGLRHLAEKAGNMFADVKKKMNKVLREREKEQADIDAIRSMIDSENRLMSSNSASSSVSPTHMSSSGLHHTSSAPGRSRSNSPRKNKTNSTSSGSGEASRSNDAGVGVAWSRGVNDENESPNLSISAAIHSSISSYQTAGNAGGGSSEVRLEGLRREKDRLRRQISQHY